MKTAIEREQCQSRLDTAEREQARPKVKLYHASTLIIEKPNHQLCILNGQMLDRHLHFIKAERV